MVVLGGWAVSYERGTPVHVKAAESERLQRCIYIFGLVWSDRTRVPHLQEREGAGERVHYMYLQ